MSIIGRGAGDSIRHIGISAAISLIINAFGTTLIGANYVFYFSILNALIAVLLIFALTKMGYAYLSGWMLGIGMLVYAGALRTGLITVPELALDVAIPITAISIKLFLLKNSND